MRCKYCGEVIRLVTNYANWTDAYIGGPSDTFCHKAPDGINPVGRGKGKWHYPDGGEYVVGQVLDKYLPNDL